MGCCVSKIGKKKLFPLQSFCCAFETGNYWHLLGYLSTFHSLIHINSHNCVLRVLCVYLVSKYFPISKQTFITLVQIQGCQCERGWSKTKSEQILNTISVQVVLYVLFNWKLFVRVSSFKTIFRRIKGGGKMRKRIIKELYESRVRRKVNRKLFKNPGSFLNLDYNNVTANKIQSGQQFIHSHVSPIFKIAPTQ